MRESERKGRGKKIFVNLKRWIGGGKCVMRWRNGRWEG